MWEKIYAYCERGRDPSFWAEPLNALTNGAFLIAGFAALALYAAQPPERRSAYGLAAALLVIVIGIGSFLFHTLAVRWAALADTIPIAIFMLFAVYTLGRRLAGAPIWAAWLGVAGFIGLMFIAFRVSAFLGVGAGAGYAPAGLMLLGGGAALLAFARAPIAREAGGLLLAAGAIFAASLTMRSLDLPFCARTSLWGSPIGTHFLWHILNGVVLYLVSRAFIRAAWARGGAGGSTGRAAPAYSA